MIVVQTYMSVDEEGLVPTSPLSLITASSGLGRMQLVIRVTTTLGRLALEHQAIQQVAS